MTWRTHLLFGISSLWLLRTVPGALPPGEIAPLALAAAFGALLPDLDAADSKIRRLGVGGIYPLAPLSSLVHGAWGHRGPLHSLVGLSAAWAAGLAAGYWWGEKASLALLLGYASHLVLDSCTRGGIPLLYPDRRRHWLLPPPLRFVTGSPAEDALLPFLAASVLLLFLPALLSPSLLSPQPFP